MDKEDLQKSLGKDYDKYKWELGTKGVTVEKMLEILTIEDIYLDKTKNETNKQEMISQAA